MDRNFQTFPNINQDTKKIKPLGFDFLNISYIKYPEINSFSYYKNLDLSLSTITMQSLLDINNDNNQKKLLKSDVFGISVVDYRQSYETFINNHNLDNNIFFINHDKRIYPLSYGFKNSYEGINNVLYNKHNILSVNIDNDTIQDNSYLYTDYNSLRKSGEFKGLFKPDNITTELNEYDGLSIKSSYISMFDYIIDENKQISNQLEDELTYIPEFRKMYGSTLSEGFELELNNIQKIEYKDQYRTIEENSSTGIYCDYGINNFYIIFTIYFKYKIFDSMIKYFMFNKNNISLSSCNIIIKSNSNPYDRPYIVPNNGTLVYNSNKSFVYNIKHTDIFTDRGSTYVKGSFKLALNFDININNEVLKYYSNIIQEIGYIEFMPTFKIGNQIINKSITIKKLIDEFDSVKLSYRLYHDYTIGYNFKNIGTLIGTCVIPENFYKNNNNIASNKPIFIYKRNFNNYIADIINRLNEYKDQNIYSKLITNKYILLDNSNVKNISDIYNNNGTYSFVKTSIQFNDNILCNHLIYYNKSYNGNNKLKDYLTESGFNIYLININNTNYANGPYEIFTNNIKQNLVSKIFSINTYNESGLRLNDLYIPNLFELNLYNSVNELYSSTFISEGQNIYILGIKNNNLRIHKIDMSNGSNNENFPAYFKIPDINVLLGEHYHLMYSKSLGYECIDYYFNGNTKNIYINIQQNYDFNLATLNKYVIKGAAYTCSNPSIINNVLSFVFEPVNRITEVLIYYTDSDYTLNNQEINGEKCRILCKICIKLGSTF